MDNGLPENRAYCLSSEKILFKEWSLRLYNHINALYKRPCMESNQEQEACGDAQQVQQW